MIKFIKSHINKRKHSHVKSKFEIKVQSTVQPIEKLSEYEWFKHNRVSMLHNVKIVHL